MELGEPTVGTSPEVLHVKSQSGALNNVVALLLDRAYVHDAVNFSTMRKDAAAVAAFQEKSAASLVGPSDVELERLPLV
jgi:hypothetical protein